MSLQVVSACTQVVRCRGGQLRCDTAISSTQKPCPAGLALRRGLRLVVIRTDDFTIGGKNILRTLTDIEVVRWLVAPA